jgi:hypothetical protein
MRVMNRGDQGAAEIGARSEGRIKQAAHSPPTHMASSGF